MARLRQRLDRPSAGFRGTAYGRFPGRTGFGGGRGAGSGSGSGHARRGGFLDLVKAWAAGIVVLAVTQYLQVTLLYENAAGRQGPQSFGAALVVVHLPNLVCVALATWAAARYHPAPQCERRARHATAACAVPLAAQVLAFTVQRNLPGYDAIDFWISTAVLVTGCGLGWAVERWRRTSD